MILGKASGWATDTGLSAADGSFIGEDAWDRSGSSVASAGDVNGDGYDDILIGANGNDDGGDAAGQTYLITSLVDDTVDPAVTIDTIADYVSSLSTVSGTASDNTGLDKVQVQITNDTDSTYWDGDSWENISNNAAWLDSTGTATWSYTMPTLTDGASYTVKARSTDLASNTSAVASESFAYDTANPSSPTNVTRTTPDTDNTPEFTWDASTDATSGIDSYEVKPDDGSWTDVGDITSYTYGSEVTDGSHTFNVRAKDAAGNVGTAASIAFTVDTTVPPVNVVPSTPTNASPANEAKSVSVPPTLTSSAFSDSDSGDTHGASQWQITAIEGNYLNSTWNSGGDAANLTDIEVPIGNLAKSTTYYWRVRHKDNNDNWSDWSAETSFTTAGGGGGLCGATLTAAPASPEDLISGLGLLGFLGIAFIVAHRKQRRRKQEA